MKRRSFLQAVPGVLLAPAVAGLRLDGQEHREIAPLPAEYFPSRLHLFVWRNWELANLDRMAKVVGATADQLNAVGLSMGLPPKRQFSEDYLKRIYITVIRQNWHVLPESQIIELLGWDEQRFRFTLKEDDFLDVKLGRVKPKCDPLRYARPTDEQNRRATEIRALLTKWFGKRLAEPGEDRFAFVEELSSRASASLLNPSAKLAAGEIDLRSGWSIIAESDKAKAAAENLRRFLAERMGAKLGQGSKQIVLRLDPSKAGWHIESTPAKIVLTASEPAALQRAVYELQRQMERREAPFLTAGEQRKREVWSPQYCYSYFALYGDPLMEGDAAGLPDGYLERAAMSGMTGVWIQAVLNTLAPSKIFPEFGEGWQTRLENLRKLVARADQFGMKIFLYLNEPRAMPASFFASHPEIRGSKFQDVYAMCTSAEPVRDWLRSSLSHLFREVPGLGGIFSITMSENHTNCFSHGGAWGDRYPVVHDCPRCSKRDAAEVIAELITTFRDGVREHSKTADVISYDWGWGTPLADALIPRLPKDTAVLSISEWSQPVHRGGVKTEVGEYSMSVVGPGPRATHNWETAKKNGLRTVAKTQFNNTWEISAVPWIPVLPLVLDHCKRLAAAGIDGVMASWTCGGYPSPNLRAAAAYGFDPRLDEDAVLQSEAERMYGSAAAADAVAAWKAFSEAFLEFPYGVAIYIIPTQHGPANLLHLTPTNLNAGMILFPYDAYKAWSGAYPPDAVRSQFRLMSAKWRDGIERLERAVRRAPATKRKIAQRELAIAKTCQVHFESTANQIEFYLLRDSIAQLAGEERRKAQRRMLELVRSEMELSRQQYFVARGESLIGYEASNHYYYTPLDLIEKMLNCDWIERQLRKELA
jgi:hypothetical protein